MRKYSITVTGPLTRSTVGGGRDDPRFALTNDVLHWLWSWRLQVERHAESTRHDGEGDTHLQQLKAFSRTSYDEHILTVVGAHLVRAIDRAEQELGESLLNTEAAEALPLLRNLYEHWAEQRPAFEDASISKSHSGKTFADRYPEGRPWSVTFDGDELLLGGVVRVHALTKELNELESKVIALEDRYRSEQPRSRPE